MKVLPGALGTKGGLRTNGSFQVLTRAGEPIQHLYASGGAANTPLGEGYPGAGGCLGSHAVTAFVAMAALQSEEPVE